MSNRAKASLARINATHRPVRPVLIERVHTMGLGLNLVALGLVAILASTVAACGF